MKHDSFNQSTEMYLKTVSELAGGGDPVPISALAGRLGVSPVSATEMVHRLQEGGLMAHQPYKGISLTADGRWQATDIIRYHRLWECFLVDHLGIAWHQAHDFACRLEHASDPDVMEALDRFLGYPITCPHGNPIPSAGDWDAEAVDGALAGLQPGDRAVVVRITETGELLAYLHDLGLLPGSPFTMLGAMPFGGPLVVCLEGEERYVGQEAAAFVYVRLIGEKA